MPTPHTHMHLENILGDLTHSLPDMLKSEVIKHVIVIDVEMSVDLIFASNK